MWDSKSGRTSPLPSYWPSLRKRILKRDNGKCQWPIKDSLGKTTKCGYPATDVDHINSATDHSSKNLQSLCGQHHKAKTAKQGGDAFADKSKKIGFRSKTKETHPGIINS